MKQLLGRYQEIPTSNLHQSIPHIALASGPIDTVEGVFELFEHMKEENNLQYMVRFVIMKTFNLT
jgi:hypothetical protein